MTGLETYRHSEPGFQIQTIFGAWRIAFFNGRQTDSLDMPVTAYERHMETDEVFVLLQGNCRLVLAGAENTPREAQRMDMEPGCIYNVRRGFWHCHVQSPDTKLLIVENADTGDVNSQLCRL